MMMSLKLQSIQGKASKFSYLLLFQSLSLTHTHSSTRPGHECVSVAGGEEGVCVHRHQESSASEEAPRGPVPPVLGSLRAVRYAGRKQ